MTSTPPGSDPAAAANATPSDRLWLRSELMGTQVITRDTGRRLGVVGEVVVDVDRRQVVALGLRDNPLTRFLPGLPRWMPLESIRQVGDVILVDSADSLAEGFNPERYSKVINCQVITEAGEQLGKVLGFSFDIETGELTTLVLGALGIPLLGEGVLSTWELTVEEIVSSGPDRIIVYEGAEEKLKQLGTGLLEKLGVGGPSWEQEERERYRQTMVPVENQLAAGQPSSQEQQRRIAPATSRRFEPEEDYDYVEVEQRREREPLRQRRYMDEELEPVEREPGRERLEPDRNERRLEQNRFPETRLRDERFSNVREPAAGYAEERVPEARFEPNERFEPAERFQPAERQARRYARDEEPLDVEPLDPDLPAAGRRDLGPDPW